MLFKSPIIESGSGSINGLTFSRNRGGNYIRGRAVPTNPNTPYQQAVRSIVAQLTSLWAAVLTQVQRDAWDLYALNTPLPNRLGDPINVGGLGMYIRGNVGRLASGVAGLTRVDDAPIIFNLGDVGVITVGVCTESADTISLAYDDTDEWCDEDAAGLLIYTSRPANAGVNFFKGPYRYAVAVEGDSASPPTSPEVVNAAFPFALDQRVFLFARVTRADGRLSTPFRGTGLGV